jgi:hypothetical protein
MLFLGGFSFYKNAKVELRSVKTPGVAAKVLGGRLLYRLAALPTAQTTSG